MTALLGLIVSQAVLAHLIRFRRRVGASTEWAAFFMYVVSAALAGAWWAIDPGRPLRWEDAVYGAVVGSSGIAGYFLFSFGMQMSGVAVMQSMGRLSIALPVAASIWVWGEHPGAWQAVGLLLVALAVPLLARVAPLASPLRSAWKIPVLVGHFAAMGIAGLAFKAYVQACAAAPGPPFFLAGFLCAAVVAAVACRRASRRASRRDVACGLALGVGNLAVKVCVGLALTALPGIVVFPVSTAGTIILSTVMAMVLWGERFGPRAVLGLVTALAAILAIQLGG
jgi:drug/metabolite transporter (DMT)-like permease